MFSFEKQNQILSTECGWRRQHWKSEKEYRLVLQKSIRMAEHNSVVSLPVSIETSLGQLLCVQSKNVLMDSGE
jgi:hypothetical protein